MSDELGVATDVIAAAAAAAFGLPDDVACTVLKERENLVLGIQPAGGEHLVLRVHRPGYRTDDELRSEQSWAAALRTDGVVATPESVPTPAGDVVARVLVPGRAEPLQITAVRWVPGEPLGDVTDAGAMALDAVARYRQLGALMASMHDHAAAWTPPAGFVRPRWDVGGMLGDAPLWGRFWDTDALSTDDRAVLERFRDHARRELSALGEPPERFGLIHGDFLPENVLVDGERLTLIDFDDSGWGWHLFDIATSFVGAWGQPDEEALEAAFLEGYRSVRPLPEEHLALLPLFLALRAATYAGWVCTRDNEWARSMRELVIAAAVELASDAL